MQSLNFQDFVAIAGGPVPFLATAFEILSFIHTTVEDVKVYRQQCKDLGHRCHDLILALRDGSSGLEGTKVCEAADAVELTLATIHERVKQWASLSRVRSFIQHSEIKDGIDKCNREVDACMTKFQISVGMDLARRQMHLTAIQERDQSELRETLQAIVRNLDDLRAILNMRSPAAVEGIMQSIQEELHNPSLGAMQEQSFLQGLQLLHKETSILPPMTDLTGQVVGVSERPVAFGAFNDIYSGKWLDSEKVALRLPRAIGNNPGVRARFENEVKIWRKLKHKNVTPLYGIVTIGDHVYSVSPWMDNGNASDYLSNNKGADKLQLLCEVACGMEYLHSNQVVHGDLRGANVLICKEGMARLSDFGLSKFLEEVGQGMSCPTGVNPRWFAPELIGQTGSLSTHSDVWSFGMLCLELITGEQPFSEVPRDINVMFALTNKQIPQRPALTSHGLSRELWTLMLKCWRPEPKSRPPMTEVKTILDRLRAEYGSSRLPVQGPPAHTIPPNSSSSGRRPSTGASSVLTTSSSERRLGSSHGSLASSPPDQDSSTCAPRRPSVSTSISSSPAGNASFSLTSTSSHASPSSPIPLIRKPSSRGWTLPFNKIRRTSSHEVNQHRDYRGALISPLTAQDGSSSHRNMPFLPQHGNTVTEAGTLDDLMERLISNASARNIEYRDIFLATYVAFTTGEEVFEGLVNRFHDTHKNNGLHAEIRVGRRYDIIMVLKHWVASPRVQVDINILHKMKEFALSVTSSETMAQLANDVAVAIDNRMRQDAQCLSILDSPDATVIPRSADTTPRDIAECLTQVEGDRYNSIRPADYIAQVLSLPVSNNVEAAYAINNKIGYWVKKSILTSDRIESRGEVFQFFVHTAEECHRLRNFASMSAVVGALQSAPISRLRLTKQALTPPSRKNLDTLGKLLDPAQNHQTYRAALGRSSSPCVPWIVVHLRDLNNIFDEYPSTVEVDGRTLINFTRFVKAAALMKDLDQYSVPKLLPNLEKLSYLQNQLRNLRIHNEDLDARSKLLEADEKKAHNMRTRELSSLGFRT